jgi:hypothetical protein
LAYSTELSMNASRTHRRLSLALGLSLVLGLAGLVQAQTTLRIAEHPGPHVEPMEEYFIPLYEELTGVNIVMEVLPPDQLWQRMQLEAQADSDCYDIGYHSPGWFGYYYEKVAGLDDLIEEHGFGLDQYSQAAPSPSAHSVPTRCPAGLGRLPHAAGTAEGPGWLISSTEGGRRVCSGCNDPPGRLMRDARCGGRHGRRGRRPHGA